MLQAGLRRRQPRPRSTKLAARTGRCAAVVGFVDAGRDLYNAAAVCAHGDVARDATASACCRTTPCSTRPATSRRATDRPAGALRHRRRAGRRRASARTSWSPNGPIAAQAAGGAELVVNINASPYHHGQGAPAGSGCWPPGPPTPRCALVYVNQVGGQDELVFDGASMVFDADGDAASPARRSSSRTCWSSTSTSTPSTASACSTRAAGRPGPRCPRSRSASEPARPSAALGAPWLAPLLDPIAEVYEALVLGTRDYVARTASRDVVHRPVRRHRLVARRRASPPTRSAPSTCTACRCRRATRATAPGPTPSRSPTNLGIDYRTIAIEPAFAAFLEMLAPSFAGREPDLTEENLQSRIRGHAAHGAVEQVRLDGAHHRQQERDGGRLLHALRRLGRRLRGDQGRAQDHGLRPVPLRQRRGPAGRSSPRPCSPSRRRPSCAPTSATTRACRPTRCSTRSSRPTSRTTAPPARSSPLGHDEAIVRRITRLVDVAEYKRRQYPAGRAGDRRRRSARTAACPITNGYRG